MGKLIASEKETVPANLPAIELVIDIGGMPILVRTASPEFARILENRYGGFVIVRADARHNPSEAPMFELDVELMPPGLINQDEDLHVRLEAGRWVMERGDFRAEWDTERRRGWVRQTANPYSIDAVLRILHSLMVAQRGGFLLHAASAVCDGRAYLFSGVSGAGKTTMTRLAPADIILLTDEISYLCPTAGGYAAFGTPFAGELAKAGENCTAPVSALFFLEKGAENRVDELSSAEAVRRLMRNILFFAEDRGLVEKLFATACDFVARVPICRLTFYPDARVWDQVRNFDRKLDRNFARSFQGVPEHA
ncbi:MAG: hypothetical protein ABSG23_09980 [Terriglobales bacterium]|jgi:hypothetical protein